eukprot:TCONS_00010393-protein
MEANKILLAIVFQIIVTSAPSTECKPKMAGDREDLISKIATQISQDGKISEKNNKLLQTIMKDHPGQPCRAVPFKQTVRHKDCSPVVINNNMCLGQCISRTDPSVNGERSQKVSKCVPTKNLRRVIPFTNCDDGKERVKEVHIVESCSCRRVKT